MKNDQSESTNSNFPAIRKVYYFLAIGIFGFVALVLLGENWNTSVSKSSFLDNEFKDCLKLTDDEKYCQCTTDKTYSKLTDDDWVQYLNGNKDLESLPNKEEFKQITTYCIQHSSIGVKNADEELNVWVEKLSTTSKQSCLKTGGSQDWCDCTTDEYAKDLRKGFLINDGGTTKIVAKEANDPKNLLENAMYCKRVLTK